MYCIKYTKFLIFLVESHKSSNRVEISLTTTGQCRPIESVSSGSGNGVTNLRISHPILLHIDCHLTSVFTIFPI